MEKLFSNPPFHEGVKIYVYAGSISIIFEIIVMILVNVDYSTHIDHHPLEVFRIVHSTFY